MIQRAIQGKIEQLAGKFPVISLTGPRQSGKTTLLRKMFPQYRYESLEDPETQIYAESDARRFLGKNEKMIIDEIQRVPSLFSYIQSNVDQANISGHYIISGSQSFLLNQHISQSLAGRVAVFNLMPLSIRELNNYGTSVDNFEKYIFKGFYPRLYDRDIEPVDFFPNYIQTYVERDVRLLQNIHDLSLFIRFLKLCAGRIGQLLNLNSLANDCGISPNTAKSWISVLEASFVIFLLQPHHMNFNKRLVKMPKLYFLDVGLAASLLEIRSVQQVSTHYSRGALFENLILCELLKNRYNEGLRNNCYFWRDNKGVEIDCLIENGNDLTPIEIKSGSTFNEDFFKNLNYWRKLSSDQKETGFVIYGGNTSRETKYGKLVAWRELSNITGEEKRFDKF
jgi:predicted AAA+ superfamily ATPase